MAITTRSCVVDQSLAVHRATVLWLPSRTVLSDAMERITHCTFVRQRSNGGKDGSPRAGVYIKHRQPLGQQTGSLRSWELTEEQRIAMDELDCPKALAKEAVIRP